MVLRKISQLSMHNELSGTTYDVCTNALLVDGECLHGQLHTIETRRFPHEVDDKVVGDLRWSAFTLP